MLKVKSNKHEHSMKTDQKHQERKHVSDEVQRDKKEEASAMLGSMILEGLMDLIPICGIIICFMGTAYQVERV